MNSTKLQAYLDVAFKSFEKYSFISKFATKHVTDKADRTFTQIGIQRKILSSYFYDESVSFNIFIEDAIRGITIEERKHIIEYLQLPANNELKNISGFKQFIELLQSEKFLEPIIITNVMTFYRGLLPIDEFIKNFRYHESTFSLNGIEIPIYRVSSVLPDNSILVIDKSKIVWKSLQKKNEQTGAVSSLIVDVKENGNIILSMKSVSKIECFEKGTLVKFDPVLW